MKVQSPRLDSRMYRLWRWLAKIALSHFTSDDWHDFETENETIRRIVQSEKVYTLDCAIHDLKVYRDSMGEESV